MTDKSGLNYQKAERAAGPDPQLATSLALQARSGNQEAFKKLVGLYWPVVWKTLFSLTGSREDAEDLAQEVFLRAWRGLPHFRSQARFSTWLYRITRNTYLSFQSKKGAAKRQAHVVSLEAAEESGIPLASSDCPPEAKLIREEREKAFAEALRALPLELREVLVLREVFGLSYQEIVETTGLELGTVKSRLHRSRLLLREKLRKWL